jgi:hypothetical protein
MMCANRVRRGVVREVVIFVQPLSCSPRLSLVRLDEIKARRRVLLIVALRSSEARFFETTLWCKQR